MAADGVRDVEEERAVLRPLARQFPGLDAALAEVARLSAELTRPKGTVHVLSDVHGEDVKLRHVINNASGTLRPLVERMCAGRLSPEHLAEFLTLIFYPREKLDLLAPALRGPEELKAFARRVLPLLFEIIRTLTRRDTLTRAASALPRDYRDLLRDLILGPAVGREPEYFDAVIDSLARHDRVAHLIHLTVRTLRNLAVDELVLAGDFWDRGPRGDRVVDYLMKQPNVSITWGNHDAAWMGACLGHEPLIAHVLRISCRYRRLSQLEEGYGVTLQPLEHLVRACYADDPAACYVPKNTGLRPVETMARMQKAAAVMQYKLEGQMIARNPEFGLDDRRLLHHIDFQAGTITLEGKTYPLKDTHFPTIDPADPYALSPEEQACMDRTRESFLASEKLWSHTKYVVERGSMWLVRDGHLIFHGCVPVDASGEFLPMTVDGAEYRGRALFEAIERVVIRALEKPSQKDLDLFWYLWCGPLSPLFGKDKIATFEIDLIADKSTHEETKNPYFKLIHKVPFCDKVMQEFGVDPSRGLIVNGHVPVKIEKGEPPLKESGKAITIDGAFSEAYGDHGYTLVLEPDRTTLALHHHFESVEAAIREGVDIVPTVEVIRRWDPPRLVADTEQGDRIRRDIALLERLIAAYRDNTIRTE
ncbi:MAG: fructose-bisphosphatase class III [Isosphaeraceae bacterium]